MYDDIISFTVDRPTISKEQKGMDFFSLLLFESGAGKHTINGTAYQILPRQLHILYPQQLHSWDIHGDVKIHVIFVSWKLFSRFDNYFVFPVEFYKTNSVIDLTAAGYQGLLNEFIGIRDEVEQRNSLREIVFSKLRIMALLISREAGTKFTQINKGTQDMLITRFILFVHANFRSQRKVSFYAEQLMITSNYLNTICRKFLGMTATEFISQEIINETKSEMLISNKTIKQIAGEINFTDLSTFSTYFKSSTGMSPSEFLIYNKELGIQARKNRNREEEFTS